MEDATYTIVEHAPLDSLAGRCLPPGARAVYFDFLRAWKKATLNGRCNVRSIVFVWSQCNWSVHETAWNNHRQSLEDAGFIECTTRSAGRFRASEKWRGLAPPPEETEKLGNVTRLRERRIKRTVEYRMYGEPLPPIYSQRKSRTA